jgi:hypothetical protein
MTESGREQCHRKGASQSPHRKCGVSPFLKAALDLGKATAEIQGAFSREFPRRTALVERITSFLLHFRSASA